MKDRLVFIDVAKALCIILVVIGHFNPDVEPSFWRTTVRFIYSFHMPVFMFISGLLFAYTWQEAGYVEFVRKKFLRLMVPYFCASVIIILLKLIMHQVLHVNNEVVPFDFVKMFFYPSAAVHLWFIWVLMLIFLVVPLSSSRRFRMILWVLTSALWISPISLPPIFCLSNFKGMAVFFMTGVLFSDFGGVKWLLSLNGRMKMNAGLGGIVLFVSVELLYLYPVAGNRIVVYIVPFVGILFVLLVSDLIAKMGICDKCRRMFLAVGRSSFFVYLFHTTFSEGVKSIISKVGVTPANHFFITLLLAVVAGVVIPVLVDRYVISKSSLLRKCFPN